MFGFIGFIFFLVACALFYAGCYTNFLGLPPGQFSDSKLGYAIICVILGYVCLLISGLFYKISEWVGGGYSSSNYREHKHYDKDGSYTGSTFTEKTKRS